MKVRNLLFVLLVCASAFFVACNDDDKKADETEVTLGSDLVSYDDASEDFEDELLSLAEEAAAHEFTVKKGNNESFAACATISQATTEGGRTVVVDFGDGCADARFEKKGKLIIEITGSHAANDFQKVITPEDFYINDHKIEGVRTVQIDATETYLRKTVTLEDGKVYFANGVTVERQMNRIMELVEGRETQTRADDVWEITGSASGVNYMQQTYTMTITSPIRRSIACRYAVSGTKTFTTNNLSVALDYGNGTCDNVATIIIAGFEREITLGKRE